MLGFAIDDGPTIWGWLVGERYDAFFWSTFGGLFISALVGTYMKQDKYGNPVTRYVHLADDYGYFVKLPAVLNTRYRHFHFDTYEGAGAAYRAAIAYRDRTLPPSQKNRVLRENAGTQVGNGLRNPTATTLGKAGVAIRGELQGSSPNGCVCVTTTGGQPTRTFSIARYGLETALRYGLRTRLEWERSVYAHHSQLSEDDWMELMWLCYEQHGNKKVSLDDIEHPGTISRPDASGIQARLMVRRQQLSAWFAYRKYSSHHEAHVAALLWCVRTHRRENPMGGYRVMAATRRNSTTGVAGVSRTVMKDRRGKPVVVYQASTKVDGKHRSIKFTVGRVDAITAEQDEFTLAIATRCRQAYEQAHDQGRPFDPGPWRDWKRRYGFPQSKKDIA